ncbi:MAG: GatB/YqeY domain-containing protein [Anaerolineae bacterium]|nr:GatB/YqeY domain-containing protein [Anaerolineae bacterium]
MTIKERLMADLKTAMREQDVVRRDTIRMARAAILNAEKALLREASEEEVIDILGRQVKQRKESIEMFQQGHREDLVAEEQAQLVILEEYLPQQLGQQEVEGTLQSIIAELGATGPQQLGLVMREAMNRLKGQADGRLVNQIARELLNR